MGSATARGGASPLSNPFPLSKHIAFVLSIEPFGEGDNGGEVSTGKLDENEIQG